MTKKKKRKKEPLRVPEAPPAAPAANPAYGHRERCAVDGCPNWANAGVTCVRCASTQAEA